MNQKLVASDGYEYENLAKRLLGEPLGNDRNFHLRQIREGYPEEECRAWYEAYDKNRSPRHSDKYDAAWCAVSRVRCANASRD